MGVTARTIRGIQDVYVGRVTVAAASHTVGGQCGPFGWNSVGLTVERKAGASRLPSWPRTLITTSVGLVEVRPVFRTKTGSAVRVMAGLEEQFFTTQTSIVRGPVHPLPARVTATPGSAPMAVQPCGVKALHPPSAATRATALARVAPSRLDSLNGTVARDSFPLGRPDSHDHVN